MHVAGVPITHVAVSNDGKCILASCLDSKVRLLETDTGELLNTYSGHHAASMRAEGRLSHDDACVLSTSEDGRVVVWDIVQAMMVRQFQVSFLLLFHTHECCCAHATPLPAQANTNVIQSIRCTTLRYFESHVCRHFQLQSHRWTTILTAGAAATRDDELCTQLPSFTRRNAVTSCLFSSSSAFVCCGVDGVVKLFGKLGA